jgi:hypothetical protein
MIVQTWLLRRRHGCFGGDMAASAAKWLLRRRHGCFGGEQRLAEHDRAEVDTAATEEAE